MDAAERNGEFLHHLRKWHCQRGPPSDQHVIASCLHPRAVLLPFGACAACPACPTLGRQSHHLPQSASHAVTLDGVAHLFRHGKPHARRAGVGTPTRLHHEGAAGHAHASGDSAKLAATFQPLHGNDFDDARANITRSVACAHVRDASPTPCGRPWSPYGRENHGVACAPACSADRSVSPDKSPPPVRPLFNRNMPSLRAQGRLRQSGPRCTTGAAYTGASATRQCGVRPT